MTNTNNVVLDSSQLNVEQLRLGCSENDRVPKLDSDRHFIKFFCKINLLTEQPKRLTTSKFGQYLAKQLTALLFTNIQPFDIKDFSLGQPLDRASTPVNEIIKK